MAHGQSRRRITAQSVLQPNPADPELLIQLTQTLRSIHTAFNHFEEVIDPTLIDCYIYELKAAQLRYQFLLRHIKQQESELN